MRWSGHFMRLGVGAVWALPACEKEASRTADNEASAASVPRLESAEGLRARATVTGSGIKGEATFVELKGNLPEPGVEIEAHIKGQVGFSPRARTGCTFTRMPRVDVSRHTHRRTAILIRDRRGTRIPMPTIRFTWGTSPTWS
jgi:hypothetical protein